MWKRRIMNTRLMNAAGEGAAAGGGDQAASGQPGAASALATGAPAAGSDNTFDYIPEKFRINGDDGAFDLGESSRRLAEAHASLEGRLGSGDVRPKGVEEYSITVPDTLKDAFDPAKDEGMQAFLKGAHEAGLSQKQLDFVMGRYFELAPKLVEGAQAADSGAAQEALGKIWATPEAKRQNLQHAYTATAALAQRAGVDLEGVMSGPLGNNPEFIRLMAAIGPELQEDGTTPGGSSISASDRETLMRGDAYRDAKHPDHKRVHEQVRRSYEKEYGTAAVL